MLKKIIFLFLYILFFSEQLFCTDTFFGTSISISGTGTALNNQNALVINGRWDLNISKVFEIGVVYSKLVTNVNANFIDNTAKTEPLIFLNYGGLDLGFYLYYDDNSTIRIGIALAGGGYKYIPKYNLKFEPYGDYNIGVYEPQLEFCHTIFDVWQIALILTYRYVDMDNIDFSSKCIGLGVKYGIFK